MFSLFRKGSTNGQMDWKRLATRWLELCPRVPIQIETISGFSRGFATKKEDFWKNYDKRPESFAKFEAMAKRGKAIPGFKAPDGADKAVAEQDYQKGEIERSCRRYSRPSTWSQSGASSLCSFLPDARA